RIARPSLLKQPAAREPCRAACGLLQQRIALGYCAAGAGARTGIAIVGIGGRNHRLGRYPTTSSRALSGPAPPGQQRYCIIRRRDWTLWRLLRISSMVLATLAAIPCSVRADLDTEPYLSHSQSLDPTGGFEWDEFTGTYAG